MRKNGFTLVELIAVIILIALIATIAIVPISKIIKDSKTNIYDNQKKQIVLAAQNWGSDNQMFLYNQKLDQIMRWEKEGKALVLAPDSIEGMGTLTKKEKPIRDLYQKGYDQGQSIIDFLSK